MTDGPYRTEAEEKRWENAFEMIGEIVFLAVVGAFFVYLFVSSLNWPLGAALMPRIAVTVGLPFLIARVVALVRHENAPQGDIMDTGFRVGAEPRAEMKRLIRICAFIVILYLAIWIFGFHVALPLGVSFYLLVYGRIGWIASLAMGAFFLAIIIGLYDNVLHVAWHEPLILHLFKQWQMR